MKGIRIDRFDPASFFLHIGHIGLVAMVDRDGRDRVWMTDSRFLAVRNPVLRIPWHRYGEKNNQELRHFSGAKGLLFWMAFTAFLPEGHHHDGACVTANAVFRSRNRYSETVTCAQGT